MDVSNETPRVRIPINYVGVEGIHIPFYTKIGGNKVNSILKIDAYIDLPASQRGIHASRSLEAIQEVVLSYRERLMRIEDIVSHISRDLLTRHTYSRRSMARAMGNIVINIKPWRDGPSSLERIKIYGKAYGKRGEIDISIKKFVGVEVSGLTACPSAKRSTHELLNDVDEEYSPTHMQRGYLDIVVEVSDEGGVDIVDLIYIAMNSFSAPTFELLKREHEARLIIDAYKKPLFTEDVVRNAVKGLIELLGRDSRQVVWVRHRSMESIHSHNLVAKIYGKISDLSKFL